MSGKIERKLELLFEMIKNSRRSDRDLARTLKVSQPTVTRLRGALEKEGLIKQYTLTPDLERMGYEIAAFTFLAFKEPPKPDIIKKAREWSGKQRSIIYAVDGEGFGMDSLMISIHKDYSSYLELINHLKEDWQANVEKTQSFIITMTRPETFVKQFALQDLKPTNAKKAHK